MVDLGMKLHSVDAAFCVPYCRAGRVVGMREYHETFRHFQYLILMAHPYYVAIFYAF